MVDDATEFDATVRAIAREEQEMAAALRRRATADVSEGGLTANLRQGSIYNVNTPIWIKQ